MMLGSCRRGDGPALGQRVRSMRGAVRIACAVWQSTYASAGGGEKRRRGAKSALKMAPPGAVRGTCPTPQHLLFDSWTTSDAARG